MSENLIVYTHKDFYITFKSPGTSFHNEDGIPGFFSQVKQITGEDELRPVHRLDKVTSGLNIMARSSEAADGFRILWETGGVCKFYLALSDSKPSKKQGLIKGDMERGRRGSWKLCRTMNNPAITRFRSVALSPGIRLFCLKIETGKSHQIRVAMKSLGSPVLGDRLYSGTESDRCYLHAFQLQFSWKGQKMLFEQGPHSGDYFKSPSLSEKAAMLISQMNS